MGHIFNFIKRIAHLFTASHLVGVMATSTWPLAMLVSTSKATAASSIETWFIITIPSSIVKLSFLHNFVYKYHSN